MEIVAIILKLVRKLFIKEKKPVSVQIQASILIINNIHYHKD